MTILTTKKNIVSWLKNHKIENYSINSDLSVDVEGHVFLYDLKLTSIPVRFNYVSGLFDCSANQLTSLLGAPRKVDGYFYCENNLLTSLKGCPEIVGDSFYCESNQIQSLEFCPQQVKNNHFNAHNNPSLGEYQHTRDFSIIKAEHLRIQAVLQEQMKLGELLKHRAQSSKDKETFKI